MIAEIGEVPLFTAENAGKLPLPFDARPIEEFEFDQVQVVPEILLLKVVTGTEAPLHIAKFAGNIAAGRGLTVIVKVAGGPVQLFRVGITVIVEVIGDVVLLTARNGVILPFPLAANPIAGFEFVQLYVAPAGVLIKAPSGISAPSQYVRSAGTVTTGRGFTVIENVRAVLTHEFTEVVTPYSPAMELEIFTIVRLVSGPE